MADTFFGFETSINNGDHLLPPDDDDCVENEEEEYDALNDETFGGLEDNSVLDDWEQQHEQFAEIAESNKQSEQIENSISLLMLDDTDDPLNLSKNSVWSYTPPNKNGDAFNTSAILSSLQKASKAFVEAHRSKSFTQSTPLASSPIHQQIPKQIRTVEELEKNLIKTSKQLPPLQHKPPLPFLPHPMFQSAPRLPPGLPPIGIPPPVRHMPMPHMGPPPGMVHHMLPPHPYMTPPHRHLMYPTPGNAQFPPHPYNYPPPPRTVIPPNYMNRGGVVQQQQQRTRNDSYKQKNDNQMENRDEYAGLMTNREKQWLLNIQMLQLNTGTPYFDDYYYTVFKERKAKNNKENFPQRFPNNRQQQRGNERQDNNNTLTPRVYTPLQFENSLGKLQCGSVTAPRKIIDMDIVTPEKDADSPVVVRDTRKTKQLLLELEALFSLLLKAEDLHNPLAINNMEKLREIKQKQRLRELDLAPTPEQKQEVLKLLKQDSEPIVENQHDYIVKIVNGLLQEEKFASFLNIRKGKMLLLRLLPHLTTETFAPQLLEMWTRILLSIPIVGRRDTAGDHILPKLNPFFKRYIQTCSMSDVLDIVTGLVEVIRQQENSRSTPLSHQGKAPLYFVLLNKFGMSALATMLIRTEYLISSEAASEKQQNDWSNFLVSWAELTGVVSKVATPAEPIPVPIFTKHCNRFENLTPEKRALLEKHVVDAN